MFPVAVGRCAGNELDVRHDYGIEVVFGDFEHMIVAGPAGHGVLNGGGRGSTVACLPFRSPDEGS